MGIVVRENQSYELLDHNVLTIINCTKEKIISDLNRYVLGFIKEVTPQNTDTQWGFQIYYKNMMEQFALGEKERYSGIQNDVYTLKDGRVVFINTKQNYYIVWELRKKQIQMYIGERNEHYFLIQEVYVMIRILYGLLISRNKFAVLHATAVDYDGQGILIIGDKGFGKTTVMTKLLAEGAKSVAVDRCFLWDTKENIKASGWISTNRISHGNLELALSKEQAERLIEYEKLHMNEKEFFVDDKLRCPMGDFLQLIKRRAQTETEISKIVILHGDKALSNIEKISLDQGIKKIQEYIFDFELPFNHVQMLELKSSSFQNIQFYSIYCRVNMEKILNCILEHKLI
jgi:Serine kinase of the HPr protein, regulates carbohydrate metabolism